MDTLSMVNQSNVINNLTMMYYFVVSLKLTITIYIEVKKRFKEKTIR